MRTDDLEVGPDTRQYLTFLLGDGIFAIDIRTIQEIIPYGFMTQVPLMPEFIRGIINLRGAVVPVIDMKSRLGRDRCIKGNKTCIVIIDSKSQTGSTQLGLMVDAVSEVIEIPSIDIEPAPQFGAPIRREFIEGMAKINNEFIVVIKPEQTTDIDVLTSMIEDGVGI